MRSRSRCVARFPPFVHPLTAHPQELISFPTPKLPRHIRDALAAQSSDIVLPESTPNPSLPFFADDYGGPTGAGLGLASSPKAGNSNGHKHKLRIPMERR